MTNWKDQRRRLEALRTELFCLQRHSKYLDLLCGDGEAEDTELQRKFGYLLWEVDEAIRRLPAERTSQ